MLPECNSDRKEEKKNIQINGTITEEEVEGKRK